jgi:two-component system sensor histidine kinase GlrK
MIHDAEPRGASLARWLLGSHGILAAILLSAVAITLWGLIAMTATVSAIKSEHLADFEEEEQVHRAAWSIETEARHGALACERDSAHGTEVGRRLAAAARHLGQLLARYSLHVSPAMARAAIGYQRFGEQVSEADVCARLRDAALHRQRLVLDEQLTDSWILKLKELRLAITQRELAAQQLGRMATLAGLGLGGLALIAAVLTARSVARSVTLPLARIAAHARRLGEGDFAPLPSTRGEPREVGQLALELDRMRVRLAEVAQLKQAFLDSVSHDLRTPLGHMREALSLLTDGTLGPLQPKQQRVAELALRACEREIRLVSALLDLSRLRSGKPLRIDVGSSIDGVIASAVDSVEELAQRSGVQVEAEAQPQVSTPGIDAVLVETALANVVANAVAASLPGGAVRLERATVTEGPDGRSGRRWLRIVVSDQGAGVDPALRDKIFEPFFTTKTGQEGVGSGLGLPLARDMLRAHGGDLTLLTTTPGQGAQFALWLPAEQDARLELPVAGRTASASHPRYS